MNALPISSRQRPNAALTGVLAAGLIVGLPVLACRKSIKAAVLNGPQSCQTFNDTALGAANAAYNLGVLAINYQQHGFIRRGLGGTILSALHQSSLSNCVHQLIVFHFLSAVWLAIPMALLLRAILTENRRCAFWMAAVLFVSPQLFWGWGSDLGRTDMFTSGCLAWAVVGLLRRNDVVAVALVLVGSLAHESAAIFGLPLMIALLLVPHVNRSRSRLLRVPVLFAIGCVAILIAQDIFTTVRPRDVAQAILHSQPPSLLRDLAAYMTTTGTRSIITSWCQSLGRAATPFYLGCTIVIAAMYAWLLAIQRVNLVKYGLAVFLPLGFISLLAIDYGRWLMFATVNGWLFAVATVGPANRTASGNLVAWGRLVVLAALFAMKPTTVFAPNRFVERVAALIWGKEGTELRSADACDPKWRTFIAFRGHPSNVSDHRRERNPRWRMSSDV